MCGLASYSPLCSGTTSSWVKTFRPKQTRPEGFGQPPPITEALPKTDIPQEVLPPLEQTTTPQGAPSSLNVFVKEIRVTGTTVFSPEELSEVAAPYVNQKLTTEDIEEVRQKNHALVYRERVCLLGRNHP